MVRQSPRKSNYKPRHRDILPVEEFEKNKGRYQDLANVLVYAGNPLHKKYPGDFGLTPPCAPRPEKTLCNEVQILRRKMALDLLKKGFERGLVSEAVAEDKNGIQWPKYVWAVTDKKQPLEAVFDGASYHGYPLSDWRTPLYNEILKRWKNEV